MGATILCGDCREVLPTLPSNSIHCVVTSPPYFGLRDYKTATWGGGDSACDHIQAYNTKRGNSGGLANGPLSRGGQSSTTSSALPYRDVCGRCGALRVDRQIGLEESVGDYVQALVSVFREVWRVLRDDGTAWCNLGDCFAGSGKGPSRKNGIIGQEARQGFHSPLATIPVGLKPKDLMGIPWRVAFALQDDGWYLRSDIVWAKGNPMPESVTDRPTRSHEYIFLLTKSPRYFYDAAAIAEASVEPDRVREDRVGGATGHTVRHSLGGMYAQGNKQDAVGKRTYSGFNDRWDAAPTATRNKRDVWNVNPQPYKAAHFAVMPQALVEPCVLAGTSAHGCCPSCGAPWKRVLEKVRIMAAAPSGNRETGRWDTEPQGQLGGRPATHEHGWEPTCKCGHEDVVPAVVLDPFAGAGTVPLVATSSGRNAIGIELNPEYCGLIRDRLGLLIDAGGAREEAS